MNLAQATAALAQKDSQRAAVIESINQLEDWKRDGFMGILSMTVESVDGCSIQNSLCFDFCISPQDACESPSDISGKILDETVSFRLKTKDSTINIAIYEVNAENSEERLHIGTGVLNVREVPEDTELKVALDCTAEGISKMPPVVVHVKTSMDNYEQVLLSKNLELQQLQRDFDEIESQIKEVRKKPKVVSSKTASKDKKKKKTKVSKAVDIDDNSVEEANGDVISSTLQFVTSTAFLATGAIVQNRAILSFVVAAAAIFTYGDLVSV